MVQVLHITVKGLFNMGGRVSGVISPHYYDTNNHFLRI